MNRMDYFQAVRKVLLLTLGLNLGGAAIKIGYGFWTYTLSMEADGYHSLFDGASNLVGLLGIWLASRPPDPTHPYGYHKYEALASLAISLLLFTTAYHVLSDAYARFFDSVLPQISLGSFLIMAFTLGINAWTVWYERSQARKLGSSLLHADATHTQSDILASIAVVGSLFAVLAGYPLLDPLVALGIALLIGRAAYRILVEATQVLSDRSVIHPERIRQVALGVAGVESCHAIRTRGTGGYVQVDLHLRFSPDMDLAEAHRLAHEVEDRIKEVFHEVVEVLVHIEPGPPSVQPPRPVGGSR